MNDYKELVKYLREEADAVRSIAIEFNIPISAENHSREAADAIEQLARDINVLTKERDAAVEDLTFSYKHGLSCFACKHDFAVDAAEYCIDCKFNSNFEWRGVQEVDVE